MSSTLPVAFSAMMIVSCVATNSAQTDYACPGTNKAHATLAIRFCSSIDLVRNVPRQRRTHCDSLACLSGCNEVHPFAKSTPATVSAMTGAGNRGANFISMLIRVYQIHAELTTPLDDDSSHFCWRYGQTASMEHACYAKCSVTSIGHRYLALDPPFHRRRTLRKESSLQKPC